MVNENFSYENTITETFVCLAHKNSTKVVKTDNVYIYLLVKAEKFHVILYH